MQQREAQYKRLEDAEYLDKRTDRIIERIESEVKDLGRTYEYGTILRKERETFKKFIVFAMNPTEDQCVWDDAVLEFLPLVGKFVKSYPGFQEKIEGKKDRIIQVVLDTLDAPDWTKKVVNAENLNLANDLAKTYNNLNGNVEQIMDGHDVERNTLECLTTTIGTGIKAGFKLYGLYESLNK